MAGDRGRVDLLSSRPRQQHLSALTKHTTMVALAPVLLAAAPAIKLVPGPVAGLALLKLRGGEMDTTMLLAMLKKWMKALFSVLTAPLWFFDAVDKEAFVMSIPVPIRRRLLKVMAKKSARALFLTLRRGSPGREPLR